MTRKDFELIATALKASKPMEEKRWTDRLDQWIHTVQKMAKMCAAQNPRFNRARFMEKAGYGGED